ncbi:hypothetical protein AHMF7605_08490 [Adhaeribacter arboris]|uniref:Uncharacterized protein n=1 Tax=Adhaeribacter arboris TaxID=2072846 RepID=A0A2T2YDI0_9BACT|nr:hypothetical protein AHMF7605_08490 [Adhaeribacter arboris]
MLNRKQIYMQPELLLNKIEWRVCAKCGLSYISNQETCTNCSLSRSKPELLAGLITTFIGITALYFLFQL